MIQFDKTQESNNETCLINTRTADEIARKVLHQWESERKARAKITQRPSHKHRKELKKVTPKRAKKCGTKPRLAVSNV